MNSIMILSGKSLKRCSYLLETECKDVVDPRPYFESCREDTCFYDATDDSECVVMAAYFRECARRGVHVEWREQGRCEMTCPIGKLHHENVFFKETPFLKYFSAV